MVIKTDNLSFSYGSGEVLKGVSFSAGAGEMLSVLGPNGAGKSTLFRCILGHLKNYKGEIHICGANVKGLPAKELAHLVAYVPQSHHPTFNYSVLDVVLMGTAHQLNGFSAPGRKEMAQARTALEQTGIAHLMKKGFMNLSGGEQQLVLIARALAGQAKLLLMDEPTSNLDFGNQIRTLQEIRNLAKAGNTIVMSSHNPQLALNYSDSIVALYDGKVIASGLPREVMNGALLKKLYGVDVSFIDTDKGRVIFPFAGGEAV